MKTFVIQLEAIDDALSIRDKMGWSKAKRILLVWAVKGPQLAPIDLRLIQRRSAQLGAQLAIVCRDEKIIASAQDSGIVIFSSVQKAQRGFWHVPRGKKPGSVHAANAARKPVKLEFLLV